MQNKNLTWKYILIIFLGIVGLLYSLPNMYGEDYAVQISGLESKVLAQDDVLKIESLLKEQKLPHLSTVLNEGNVLIRFADTDQQLKASDYIKATVGENYVVAPNLAPRTPKWLQAIGAKPLKLGLDLRGGVHFLMSVDIDAVTKARENGDIHSFGNELKDAKIRYSGLSRSSDGAILIKFKDAENLHKADSQLPRRFPEYLFTQNLSNGIFELKAIMTEAAVTKLSNYAVEQSMSILQNRINELGVSEAVIQRQGVNKISVDLPGVQDTARAKEIIGKTATLEFHMVDVEHDVGSALSSVAPVGTKMYDYDGRHILLKNQIILSGSSITFATSAFGEDGRPEVNVQLGGGGENVFHRVTAENIGKPMAVIYVETKTEKKIVNGVVETFRKPVEKIISVATIQSALGNSFRITGLESQAYAQNLALLLRSGAFTAPIDFIQERIVGPSLGKANIAKGVMSMVVGSLFVFLFMLLYYRLFGFFTDLALILNIFFIISLLSLLGATLTLPGIAAIVLTVGMAVDANVLINERIREELRAGMSPLASIKAGYERAFSTIVDANVTTMIVAVALFALGSGAVKGFAIILLLGLMTSMFTSIFVTHALVNLFYGSRQVRTISIGTVRRTPVL